MSLSTRTARLAADVSAQLPTSFTLESWRGNAFDLELGVFDGTTVQDLSDVSSITCIARNQSQSGIAMTKTVASADIDNTLDSASWQDESKQHVTFSFTNSETNVAMGSDLVEYWMVFTAIMNDGAERTLAAGCFNLYNDRNNTAGNPPLNPGTSITLEQADARYLQPGSGVGDMLAATYDPTSVEGDAFDMDNMVEGADAKVMTASERSAITSNQTAISGKQDALTVSDTAPASPDAGDLWLDSTQAKLYTYYNDGDSSQWVSVSGGLSSSAAAYEKLIVVNQSNVASTLGGTIDSSKVYFIDGVVDLGSTQVTVPTTGITIKGHSFDISKLTSSEDNYTMFISESIAIGSGNVLGADYAIEVTGAGSKVYELYDATGFNAFEFARINYNDCTSLGDLYDYRQGLEEGTGRFGGSPSLTLHGLWRGGYRITTSIVRSLAGTMTEPLFKEGTAFQMTSRFLTDINCDLPTLAPFCDFTQGAFANPSTVQLKGCIFSRDGAFNANDTNIFTDLNPGDLQCDWDNNIGVGNTFVGGRINCDTEAATSIVTAGTAVDINGTFGTSDLQHFDSPSSGVLRHIGVNPKEFTVNFDLVIQGGNNDEVEVFLIKIDTLAQVTVEYNQLRVINNFVGGRDVAYFTGQVPVRLNQNDLVFWQVANVTDTTDVTLEVDSSWSVSER